MDDALEICMKTYFRISWNVVGTMSFVPSHQRMSSEELRHQIRWFQASAIQSKWTLGIAAPGLVSSIIMQNRVLSIFRAFRR